MNTYSSPLTHEGNSGSQFVETTLKLTHGLIQAHFIIKKLLYTQNIDESRRLKPSKQTAGKLPEKT